MASDTTSQTTHQTNTLKALSTLTLYNLICVIRAFIDIGTILQLASSHYNADVVNLHIYILWFVPYCLYKTVFSYLHNTLVFYHIGIWCEHAFCIFPAFSTASIKRSEAADLIPSLTLVVLRNISCLYSTWGGAIFFYMGFSTFQHLVTGSTCPPDESAQLPAAQ